ncbi:MAG TPA: DUF4382 domain-containing protein [Terriglobales bacterium]|jgi:hypothetical protein|nr:DUF4382 domain-containing protein [Terriglobales bacterium]
MKRFLVLLTILALSGLALVGCGGGNSSATLSANTQSGAVFVTGEDAPLPSVVSLNLTINSITLTGASNSSQLVSSPITVDFARLVGLREPLAFNSVPADTYSSATFVLSSPVINYISAVNPPQVSTLNGTFSNPASTSPQTTSVTVNFPTPMVVTADGLAGLHTEFDIRQSLAVDGSGQITGVINPVMVIQAVKATNPEGQITDLTGTVVSVNTASSSFVMQGPFGHQFTVAVNGSTNFNQGFTLATLPATGGFVAIQGTVQMDGSILASDVEFITTDRAFISGRILALNPTSGPVQTVTLWVGETGGSASGLVDTVQTVDVSSVTTYDICFFNNSWFSPSNLFGDSSMLVGQRIFIGGTFTNSTFAPDFISLRRQGVYGMVVPGSVIVTSGNAGNFQLLNTGLLGMSLGGPLTVNTGAGTVFFQGNSNTLTLMDLQTASATVSVPAIARGLVLKDSTSGDPVLWAHRVRETQ